MHGHLNVKFGRSGSVPGREKFLFLHGIDICPRHHYTRVQLVGAFSLRDKAD